MRKIVICLLPAILLLLGACESGAKFRVINRTSHPIYTSLGDSELITVPGGTERVIKVDTDTQSFLTGTVKKRVQVLLYGETFSLVKEVNKPQSDSTIVEFEVGKTLNAYADPNRAGIKVVNLLDIPIYKVEVVQKMLNYYHNSPIANLFDILPGDTSWLRVPPVVQSPNNDPFYFQLDVYINESDTVPYVFSNHDSLLGVDDQMVVTITPDIIDGDTK